MTIVLIGAGGFLGNSILRSLSKGDNGNTWHLFSSTAALKENHTSYFYKWPQNTLTDAEYQPVLAKADVIIYAAGAGVQPGEVADDELIFNLNLFEPVRLVQSLIKQEFKGQLITFGSYFETGKNQEHELLTEQQFLEQCNPLPNIYCRSKKELTHFHFAHQQSGITFKWLHLILTNIYGPGENKNRLIPYIIDQSRQGFPLHFTAGSQLRQYTYVGDVANVVRSLLGKASGLYHVTNEETLSVKMVIEEAVKQARNKWSLEELHFDLPDRRDTAMEYLAVSAKKLTNEWGLSCPTSLKKGIAFYFDNEAH